jgi:hypothetical protein
MTIIIDSPEDENATHLDLKTDDGEILCEVHYDDQPDAVLHKVAKALCKKFNVKFDGLSDAYNN